jgi:large subunit ribosomal protein L25
METLNLEVKSRESLSPKAVRDTGLIPAVFYGPKQKNQNFTVDYQSFRRVYAQGGQNTVIELTIDGKDKTYVLVQDLQFDPVSDKFTHIDFKYVDLNKEIETEVPLELIGESKAVREMQGTIVTTKDFITVKCLAKNIPHTLKVDISVLEDFTCSIRVKDIALPEGVLTLDDLETVLVNVAAPKAEEEETAAPAEGAAAEGAAPAEGAAATEAGKDDKAKSKADKES